MFITVFSLVNNIRLLVGLLINEIIANVGVHILCYIKNDFSQSQQIISCFHKKLS